MSKAPSTERCEECLPDEKSMDEQKGTAALEPERDAALERTFELPEEEKGEDAIYIHEKLNLDDDTSWPDPRFIRDAAWKSIYNPDQLTEHDRATLFSCVDAYFHLLTHPWGTEASIRKIRMLRRAIRLNEKEETK